MPNNLSTIIRMIQIKIEIEKLRMIEIKTIIKIKTKTKEMTEMIKIIKITIINTDKNNHT